jgi:hypothetical protein
MRMERDFAWEAESYERFFVHDVSISIFTD